MTYLPPGGYGAMEPARQQEYLAQRESDAAEFAASLRARLGPKAFEDLASEDRRVHVRAGRARPRGGNTEGLPNHTRASARSADGAGSRWRCRVTMPKFWLLDEANLPELAERIRAICTRSVMAGVKRREITHAIIEGATQSESSSYGQATRLMNAINTIANAPDTADAEYMRSVAIAAREYEQNDEPGE